MAKFDYKKWVTDYKYSGKSLFEQSSTGSAATGSATGSASTGSASTGSASTGSISKPKPRLKRKPRRLEEQLSQWSCPQGTFMNPLNNGGSPICTSGSNDSNQTPGTYFGSSIEDPSQWVNVCCTGSNNPGAETGSEATGSITGSCGNFGTLPSSIQLTACQAYYNLANPQSDPNLTQWVDSGNCCEGIYTGSMATGSMATGSMATGSMATGSMAQGMPSMTRRPQRRMPQRRMPTRGLREVKNIIRKLIKEQGPSVAAPIGTHGSGVSTTGRYVVVRPCNHSPNGSTTIFPIMANMTIDGVAPQVGDVFFRNYSNVNLSGNGISGGQQSKWEVIETFPAADNVSTTYDRPSVSCEQPVYGSGNYTSIPGAASVGDLVYFRCAVSNQYSQTPGVSQGCLPTSTLAPFNTLEECEASGCAPGTVNDPDGDGVADMIRPKKMQAPVKDKMPMKRGATTKPSMPNRQMPMKENNLLEELKNDLKRKK